MDSDQAKLFVGGISHATSEETLKRHFSRYGDVVSTVIMRDRNTGSTRGFGFVTFMESSAADKALHEQTHEILGRTVEVKRAVPRSEHQPQQHYHQHFKGSKSPSGTCGNCRSGGNNHMKAKKIFVGGLSPSLTEEEFKAFFEKFGKITDVVVMYDSVTHRPRGFGFITFDSEEAVDNVMQKSLYKLNDKLVEVKRAIPKEIVNGNNWNGNGNFYSARAAGGGRGSAYAGYRGGAYQSFDPRFSYYQNYGFPGAQLVYGNGGIAGCGYGYGYGYGGPYPMGVYSAVNYGSHLTLPSNSWNGFGMVDESCSPASYGGVAYPGYVNGGVGAGYTAMPYGGMMGPPKCAQSNGDVRVAVRSPQSLTNTDDSVKTEDSSSLNESQETVPAKQTEKGDDGILRPCTTVAA